MSVRDFIRKALEKRAEKGRKLKEMQEDIRLNKLAQDRMKSPQERELEAFLEKERQDKIKQHVQTFRDKEKGNLVKGNLMDRSNIFKEDSNILQAPNIFGMKAQHQEGMFFK